MRRFAPFLIAVVATAVLLLPAWGQSQPAESSASGPSQAPTTAPDVAAPLPKLTVVQAAVLGVVEGLTEYLPVSSTGHLILTNHALGLTDPRAKQAVDAYTIVIQAGAILAVLGLYRRRVGQMLAGLVGRNREGLRLFALLFVACIPAAVIGLPLDDWIERVLFRPWPVVAALAAGGLLMIIVGRGPAAKPDRPGRTVDTLTFPMAIAIGLAQCLAMWPGTSRSMVTIVAALLLGMRAKDAAEFSFLLALPTLGGASLIKLVSHHAELMQVSGVAGLVVGVGLSWVVAALAVKGFVAWLNRHGLAPFGWYRIALAGVLLVLVLLGGLAF